MEIQQSIIVIQYASNLMKNSWSEGLDDWKYLKEIVCYCVEFLFASQNFDSSQRIGNNWEKENIVSELIWLENLSRENSPRIE